MNQRWVEFTDLPYEQLIGRHVREFAPTGKAQESYRFFSEPTENQSRWMRAKTCG